ncbi:MAG: ComEC/Rec2 family competence protein [Patescibacteria group bacterium]
MQFKKTIVISSGALFLSCMLVCVTFWYDASSRELTVTFFDVGQGDSIFIQTPSRHTVLIDGGPDAGVLAKVGRRMPFYDRTIDLVILTHVHADHIAGLVPIIERYDVGTVLFSNIDYTSPEYRAWLETIDEKEIEAVSPRARLQYQFGEVDLEILYPFDEISGPFGGDINDTSVVARMQYGSTSFLFTGDASASVEGELLLQYGSAALESDVLKVGHHGSKYSSSLEFLEVVGPRYAVVQVGEGNSFSHPHRMVMKRLEGLGISVYRTDELGDITLCSDGSALSIE